MHNNIMVSVMHQDTQETTHPKIKRGHFDQIVSIFMDNPIKLMGRFSLCLPETFMEFDKAKRGDALNCDLYGFDPAQNVAVIQIRHSFRRYRNGYLNTHVDYVLVGFNEITNQPFRHPVSAQAVRTAIRRSPKDPAAPIRAAQRWMWQVTDRQLDQSIRQGDVLLVPERGQPKAVEAELGTTYLLGGSHEIRAERIVRLSRHRIWALSPAIWHAKDQHDPVFADHDGWHSVRLAREAPTWRWGERLGD